MGKKLTQTELLTGSDDPAADYWIMLHCHDEAVAEVPIDFGSVDEFGALMTELPDWARGLPLTAEAWCGDRYVK